MFSTLVLGVNGEEDCQEHNQEDSNWEWAVFDVNIESESRVLRPTRIWCWEEKKTETREK